MNAGDVHQRARIVRIEIQTTTRPLERAPRLTGVEKRAGTERKRAAVVRIERELLLGATNARAYGVVGCAIAFERACSGGEQRRTLKILGPQL